MNADDVPEVRTTDSDLLSADGFGDAVFAALADRRRRIAIRLLSCRNQPVAVADLARRIAVYERDDDRHPDEKRVYLELFHVHVPKLVEADLLEYDRERNTVEGTDALEPTVRLLALYERSPVER